MSRRHQSHRRKAYGRRQHEVRERHDRASHSEAFGPEVEPWGSPSGTEPFPFTDPRQPRLHYAGD
jgi:hypothetical protein